MTVTRKNFRTLNELAPVLVENMGTEIRKAIAERGRAFIALSGGRSPRHIYPLLTKENIDWAKVTVTLTDERWVPVDDEESNEKLVLDYFQVNEIASVEFVGLKSNDPDPVTALKETEIRLRTCPWPLDVVFLGMGEDGHIASLFPGDTFLPVNGKSEKEKYCISIQAASGGFARMSLSPAAILKSRTIMLVFAGKEKLGIFESALKPGSVVDLPVRLILHQDLVPVTVYQSDQSFCA